MERRARAEELLAEICVALDYVVASVLRIQTAHDAQDNLIGPGSPILQHLANRAAIDTRRADAEFHVTNVSDRCSGRCGFADDKQKKM